MPNAELRPYASPWGHCAATPSREGSGFLRFLDACMAELLEGRAPPMTDHRPPQEPRRPRLGAGPSFPIRR